MDAHPIAVDFAEGSEPSNSGESLARFLLPSRARVRLSDSFGLIIMVIVAAGIAFFDLIEHHPE